MYNSGLYTGGQRITMVTYSDIGVRIPEVVNSGFTGMAYAPELMGWSAPGEELHAIAFSPFMVDNEWIFCCHLPWRTSASSFATYLKYVKLHYRLIPYIYSHFWEQHTTGVGPIRPLQIEFQDDPQTYSISNQYFYGRNLMVSFDHSTIYLPQGKWIYYWNGRVYEGKQTLQNFGAPSDELPVFVRGGAIIPMMPDMNYVGEKPIDPLIVDVYPQGSSEFTLFEDDGISFNYEKGDYCETRYENTGGKAIIINARNSPGQYSPPARSYLFKVHYGSDPKSIYLNSTALSKKASEAKLLTSKNGWYYSNGLVEVVFADNGALMRLGLGKPVPSAASSDFENK
jgi:alpha-glucosidase (family GH31 glycosyl hydrolase)